MINVSTIQKKIDRLYPLLKRKYNIKRLALFGSYVRNEAYDESDIDLLVEFSITPDLLTFIELEEFLGAELGKKVDLVPFRKLKNILKERILREAVYL